MTKKDSQTETKKENNYCPKVLFQVIHPVLFRTTLIGNLYEISQIYPTILLFAGKIDSETEKILENRELFPKLQKIIFTAEPFYEKILSKNFHLYRTIKKVVKNYRPDIVIAADDFTPGSLYLIRFAKKLGAITIVFQSGFQIAEGEKLYLWSCLTNSYLKVPIFFPFFIRMFLVKTKKYLGHFFYYWILPLTVGEMPFRGKSSFIFWKTSIGLRDADYSVVFSKRDYDLSIKDGVSPEKLFVLGHPLEHKSTRRFFEKVYFSKNKEKPVQNSEGIEAGGRNPKTLTVMWPDEKIGFSKKDYSLIPEKKMKENRIKIIKLISEILKDWKIFIKPHPAVKNISEVESFLGSVPDNVIIIDPSEPADKYIEISSIIVGTPPPSTTLFIAQKQNPEKIILSLNLNSEFLGDTYKDFDGIEYIDSEEKLINALNLIRDNKYYKKRGADSNSGFSDINKLLDYIYTHHLKTSKIYDKCIH